MSWKFSPRDPQVFLTLFNCCGGGGGMQMQNHLPIDEHLSCFQLFALANNAAEKNLYPGFLGYIVKYFYRTEIARLKGMHVFLLGWILPSPHPPPWPKSSTSLHSQQLPRLPSAGTGGFFAGVSLPFCLVLLQIPLALLQALAKCHIPVLCHPTVSKAPF